ncbi:MAG: hypothetical protein KC457_03350 [Myxococcales bacterium]|nr:hypothetical protein [Myxococcales bacterium]
MADPTPDPRFTLRYEPETYRRIVAGKSVIIHCHHYNARVQRTVEGSSVIDGKTLFREAAASVFAEQLAGICRADEDAAARLRLAAALYTALGFGSFDLGAHDLFAEGACVRAPSSHYVEGWLAGFGRPEGPVCTFSEGYLEAAIWVATGRAVEVRERACMACGAEQCEFEVRPAERAPAPVSRLAHDFAITTVDYERSANVDEQAIIDALVAMPIIGDQQGLIPAFGVYLANTPADFYNQVCIRFIEAMTEKNRARSAKRMLVADGEMCAMNTFRGIMNSVEWEGLVAPMIHETRDNLFALVAISNGLGWGNWHITSHPDPARVSLISPNGYEALGHLEFRGPSTDPICFMLTGVAAGMLELVYGEGPIDERLGTFLGDEQACICQGVQACRFDVQRAT